jgi:parallel beta-helix repeat protein
MDYSQYNTFSGNTIINTVLSFFVFYSSNNSITGNTIEDFWGISGIYVDPNSYNNTIENNTVIATGLPFLLYVSFYNYQQGAQTGSNILIVGVLVTVITVIAVVGSVLIYKKRTGGAPAVKGKSVSKAD